MIAETPVVGEDPTTKKYNINARAAVSGEDRRTNFQRQQRLHLRGGVAVAKMTAFRSFLLYHLPSFRPKWRQQQERVQKLSHRKKCRRRQKQWIAHSAAVDGEEEDKGKRNRDGKEREREGLNLNVPLNCEGAPDPKHDLTSSICRRARRS